MTKPAVSHVHTKMVTPAEVDHWLKVVIKRLELCVGFVRAEVRAEVRVGVAQVKARIMVRCFYYMIGDFQ